MIVPLQFWTLVLSGVTLQQQNIAYNQRKRYAFQGQTENTSVSTLVKHTQNKTVIYKIFIRNRLLQCVKILNDVWDSTFILKALKLRLVTMPRSIYCTINTANNNNNNNNNTNNVPTDNL